MLNKTKSIVIFLLLILFFFLVVFRYFSEENKNIINSNRADSLKNIEKTISKIPLLKSDTENIIEYPSINVENEKVKKRSFWNLLKKK